MNLHTAFYSVLKGLIVVSVVLFLSAAGFQDKLTSGWYQQYFPNLNGSTIKDLTFLDSLTGFAVTTTNSSVQAYIVKTTNGGDNWNINYTYVPPSVNSGFNRIQFANSNTGYASINYFDFIKTTNSGLNWTVLTTPWGGEDMAIINPDTIFLADSDPIFGGIYRTANGGLNWSRIWTNGMNGNPEKIYMVNKDLGFTQEGSNFMRRTTNGGFNWTLITGEFFTSIKFFDSNTGWKVFTGIKKTTNGGSSWFTQITPAYSNNFSNYYTDFAVMNKDTVWMVGAIKFSKPPIYKTTNGGLNWGYEIPDTTVQINNYTFIKFVNSKIGWIGPATPSSILHTKVGGNDTTIFTGVYNNSGVVLSDYQLYQNYPNPFNPSTIISYKLAKSVNICIKVFDISGKEIEELVNKKLQAGSYKITFNLTKYSSGIYFYSMIIDGTVVDTKKMIYLK